MKKYFLLLFCFLSLPSFAIAAENESFQASAAWKKLDVPLQAAWKKAAKRNENPTFQCQLHLKEQLSPSDKIRLNANGFHTESIADTILTGSVTAQRLPKIAEFSFVETIELVTP